MAESFTVEQLTRDGAEQRICDLLPLMGLIEPGVANADYLLGEERPGGIPLIAKWQHSLVVELGEDVVGMALVYERQADGCPLYEDDELHVGILSVEKTHQGRGLGSQMLRYIVDRARSEELFSVIPGTIDNIGLTVADYKSGPMRLYAGFGFTDVGVNERGGTEFHIMRASLDQIEQSPRYKQTQPMQTFEISAVN